MPRERRQMTPKRQSRSRSRSQARTPTRIKQENVLAQDSPIRRSPGRPPKTVKQSPSRQLRSSSRGRSPGRNVTETPKAERIVEPRTSINISPARIVKLADTNLEVQQSARVWETTETKSRGRPTGRMAIISPKVRQFSKAVAPRNISPARIVRQAGSALEVPVRQPPTALKTVEPALGLQPRFDSDSDLGVRRCKSPGRKISPRKSLKPEIPSRQSERISMKLSNEAQQLIEEIEARFKTTSTPSTMPNPFDMARPSSVEALDFSDVDEVSVRGVDEIREVESVPAVRVKISKFRSGLACLATLAKSFIWPIFILLTSIACEQNSCALLQVPAFSSDLYNYLDFKTINFVLGFVTTVFLLKLLPQGFGRFKGYLSGKHLIMLEVLALAMAYDFYPAMFSNIQERYIQLLASCTLVGVLISIVSTIVPVVLRNRIDLQRLQFKEAVAAIPWLAVIALNFAYLLNNVNAKEYKMSPTLYLAAAMQILYSCAQLWFLEDINLPTPDLSWILYCMMQPFLFSMSVRYVALSWSELNVYALAAIGILFCISFYIFCSSNYDKVAFKLDPHAPKFQGYEFIPTGTGERIFAGRLWGEIRHPDYFADFLMHVSLTFCGSLGLHIYLLEPLMTFVMLIKQARLDDAWMSHKYGPAWDRYCLKAKSRLIPGIY
ncbi:uncharacterized protein LOC136030547 [Artemia franciscana]|uniref:Uncharacterized protein n=1 Tax=Artemia franciscana TaxID=6661 RepID=A0AA88HIW5_ARTSF|nr:hypothetical protein QYM36_016267 [Artemia franciscana]